MLLTIIQLVACAYIVAPAASFFVTLAYKWGIVDHVQMHGNKFFNHMFSCEFCLSFWSSMAVSLVLAILASDWSILFVPCITTNITRRLL